MKQEDHLLLEVVGISQRLVLVLRGAHHCQQLDLGLLWPFWLLTAAA